MYDGFSWRHIPPVALGSLIAFTGNWPFIWGHESALLQFGFPSSIAKTPAAGPVIAVGSARISTIGISIVLLYLNGHYEAMDIVIGSMAWIGLIDTVVMAKHGAPGSASFRFWNTAVVAAWGLLGMTTGKWI